MLLHLTCRIEPEKLPLWLPPKGNSSPAKKNRAHSVPLLDRSCVACGAQRFGRIRIHLNEPSQTLARMIHAEAWSRFAGTGAMSSTIGARESLLIGKTFVGPIWLLHARAGGGGLLLGTVNNRRTHSLFNPAVLGELW